MDMSAYPEPCLQLDKICRACLTEKSVMKPLYDSYLYKMLNSFVPFQVKQDDGLPSLLCEQCVLQCSNAYTFKQLCENSDSILRKCIKPEFQTQIQEPVSLIDCKIEVDDDSNNVEQYAEIEDVLIKDEIKSESDSCAESDFKSDLSTIDQADNASQPPSAPNEHVCAICSKAFARRSYLKIHSKIHLSNKSSYKCDQCDKTFTVNTSLSKHKRKHTVELKPRKLYGCNYCEKQYVQAFSLKIHLRTHTGERPYVCDVCEKTFTQACHLKDHVRVHTGVKVPKKGCLCPVCGKSLTQANSLRVHMRTHTGVRPYVCRTCEKAYATLDRLKNHERVHTGEKPYCCEICGACFSWRQSLFIHTRTHTGVKSHFCDFCGKGFDTACRLAEHKKTHTGEKPHECGVCGWKFTRLASLKSHMKNHLKLEGDQEQHTMFFNENIETEILEGPIKMSKME